MVGSYDQINIKIDHKADYAKYRFLFAAYL